MRRFICLFAALLIGLSGCAESTPENAVEELSVLFFYESADLQNGSLDSVIATENRSLTRIGTADLLSAYFKGPLSEDLVNPFPQGVRVLEARKSENEILLVLSEEFFSLSGIDLSIASYCLSSTVCLLESVERVVIIDQLEHLRLEMEPDNFLLENMLKEENDQVFTLYFPNSDLRYLTAEFREVTLSDNTSETAYLFSQLLAGPEESGAVSLIPKDTKLRSLTVENGLCTINLSREFWEDRTGDDYGDYMTLYSIVNTLTSVATISSVQVLCEGENVETYGIFDISVPLSRYTDAIGPVRTYSGELDINIYCSMKSGEDLFAFPARVKQSASAPLTEAVLSALLGFKPVNGFYNPIPAGTEILSVSHSGSVCYVDLSGRFVPVIDTAKAESQAVAAVVLSLTDLDTVESVAISINGESNSMQFIDISEPISREDALRLFEEYSSE